MPRPAAHEPVLVAASEPRTALSANAHRTGPAYLSATGPPTDVGPNSPRTGATSQPAATSRSRSAGGFLVRAAGITAGLSAAGSVLGLVRDQAIAHLFGAGAASDAFLVAWTVPELASTVLIEDAMALLLVPAFSGVLARAGGGGVRSLVRDTLPRLVAVLAAVTALLVVGAPYIVDVLAPGLRDTRLAVDCTRLTAVTVFSFGLTGYLSAALRAHRRFLAPAAIYVAYNVGIIVTLVTLHGRLGVRAAAAGVAIGGVLMVAVQLPTFLRETRRPRAEARPVERLTGPAGGRRRRLGLALLAPVIVFTVSRQAQVLIERFFASDLRAGAISHLNYAQKVAQIPMVLSLMICTVTFPVVSRALAEGDRERARRQVEHDLMLACLVVLLGTAYVIACAPQIVQVLFQRGAFTAADTGATASVMRVYALGLLGQCLVGALIRPYFSAARPTWYPAAVMGVGLAVTTGVDAAAVGRWGSYGIAAGNAAGITVTAALLLRGLATRGVPVRARTLTGGLGRVVVAAAVATGAGWGVAAALPGPALGVLAGCVVVPVVFAAAAAVAGVPEVPYLFGTVKRRLSHAS